MCGRFTLTLDVNDLQEELGIRDFPPEWGARYNIAPTQPLAVVRDPAARKVELMRWGLVPSWAKDAAIGNKLINARAETVAEKPSFRQAYQKRRCLLLADGFYEWQKDPTKKSPPTPYFFSRVDRRPFAFAGLWEFWRAPEGDPLLTCALITTTANELVAPVHERMPVMLTGERLWEWIRPGDAAGLADLLKPYDPADMVAYPVSRKVNDPGFDAPEALLPLAS